MELGQIYYDSSNTWILNLVLASIIFGIALDIRWQDFKAVAHMPKAVISGLVAQFLILPAATTVLTLFLDLDAGIELGMILVSACPGGAVSNFITHLSGGNTALSISMTAISSALAVVMMPINFIFWAGLNSDALALLKSIDVDSTNLFITLFVVLAIPLSIGLYIKKHYDSMAQKLHKFFKVTSVLALIAFIVIAVVRNHQAFVSYFNLILSIVLVHNALAYFLGFSAGKIAKLSPRDTTATTIEVGMQNSSLAIAIVFSQFGGEAGMALISAFWGTWHLVSGLLVATMFRYYLNRISATTEQL